MKIPAQQNGNPLAACYCSQLEKALSEVNYAKPLKRQFFRMAAFTGAGTSGNEYDPFHIFFTLVAVKVHFYF